jgi:hypothetical protein
VTSFIGRDEDLAAVTGMLEQARLLTLHGPGGVGKTRASHVLSPHIPKTGALGHQAGFVQRQESWSHHDPWVRWRDASQLAEALPPLASVELIRKISAGVGRFR